MNCCINCGCILPPLNGCEENDFATFCETCDIEEIDDCDIDEETYGNEE